MNKSGNSGTNEFVGDVFLDAESFSRLKTSTEIGQVVQSILKSLSRLNKDFAQIILVLADGPSSKMQPAGVWPDGATPERPVLLAIQGAAKADKLILEKTENDTTAIALPLKVDGRLVGVFGVMVANAKDKTIRSAIDHIQWATGWIEAMLRRRKLTDGDGLGQVIEILATSLHHARFQESATAVATELANTLGCERVSIGFVKGRHCKLRALSNSANFQKKASLIAGIQAAMEEAIDQQASVIFPEEEGATARVSRAHEALAKDQDSTAIASIPLTEGKRVIGAITLEKEDGEKFDANTIQTAEYAAVLLGPVLDVKRREDRWLPAKAWDAFKSVLGKLIGPRHWGLKLGTLALIGFVCFCIFAKGDYRITAKTVVEGKIQRSITVPLAGFLAEAPVRAGDVVNKGDVIALMDDRDLRLERLKWASQRTQQNREYSQAIAGRQRTEARILESQIKQADAQLELLDQQLERMRIRAPFSGLIVSGDLSQALGAPLERGDVIFEIAPMSDFRIMLRVDERDIRDVQPNQTGNLVLSAFPDADIELQVDRITPISTAAEGENFFVVEGSLTGEVTEDLRPGMEGVAKILVKEERLVKIWTKRTWLWLRMWAWTWWP